MPPILSRVFSPAKKMFVCNLKLSKVKQPQIERMFIEQYGRPPPTKNGIYKMLVKLKSEFTLRDLRKGNSGRKFTVRTLTNM